MGVLASASIAGAYGAPSMRVRAQGPARARPALFATCGTVETTGKSLTLKGIPTINKRLGEICGLAQDAPFQQALDRFALDLEKVPGRRFAHPAMLIEQAIGRAHSVVAVELSE